MYCKSLHTVDTNACGLLTELLSLSIKLFFTLVRKKSCRLSAVPPHIQKGAERLTFIACGGPSEAHNLSPWVILTAFSWYQSTVYFICYTSLFPSDYTLWKSSPSFYQVKDICLTSALWPNEDPFLSSRKFKNWIHTRNFKNISQKDETHSGYIIGNNSSFHPLYTINNTKRLSCHLIRLHRF